MANGVGKGEIVLFHDETEHVPALSATEAMPQLRNGVYLARWSFLVMERAATPEIAPPLAKRYTLADNGDDVACFPNLLDILVADCHIGIIAQTAIRRNEHERNRTSLLES